MKKCQKLPYLGRNGNPLLGTKRAFWPDFGYKTGPLDRFWVQNWPSGPLLGTKLAFWPAFRYKTGHLDRFWVELEPTVLLLSAQLTFWGAFGQFIGQTI